MSDLTIPDAIAADLEAIYLANPPAGLDIDADRLRKRSETGELPSPRLVILCGEPRYVKGMTGTARVPVSLEYITSQDRVHAADHEAAAGKLDAWWRSLAIAKRNAVITSQIYLHKLIITQPGKSMRADEREQVTAIRGDLVVTLVAI